MRQNKAQCSAKEATRLKLAASAVPLDCCVGLLALPYLVLVLVVASPEHVEGLHILNATKDVTKLLHGVHR